MTAVELLRMQFQSVHDLMEKTMSDVTHETANFTQTSKAVSPGVAYAHALTTEDVVISSMLQQKTPLLADNSITGLSEPVPSFSEWDKYESWTKRVRVDMQKCKEYAQRVYTQTSEYLSTLSDEDLVKEYDLGPFGKQKVVDVLNNFLLLHFANGTGEASAAKGFQDLKGYPF